MMAGLTGNRLIAKQAKQQKIQLSIDGWIIWLNRGVRAADWTIVAIKWGLVHVSGRCDGPNAHEFSRSERLQSQV